MHYKYCYRIPAYLNHDPPVLLHPERVVPMSESERFELSYQPNVALAPRATVGNRRAEVSTFEHHIFNIKMNIREVIIM